MRIPRISVGTALVAMVVTGTTASAFALSGAKVPAALSFQSASSERTAPSTTSTTVTTSTTKPAPRPERKPEPPRPTTTTTAKRAEPVTTVVTTVVTTTPVPKPEPKPEPRPEPKPELPTTTTAPPPTVPPTTRTEPKRPEPTTTSTTAPRTTSTTEKHVEIPVTINLTCGTAVVNGLNAMSCGWTQSDNPAFASYRFFRSTASGAGQILFTSTDPAKHSWGTTTGLVTGESSTYTVQALDVSGHILATSPQVVVACCSQSFAK